MKRIKGTKLIGIYALDLADARYRRNGIWYHPLRAFPGGLFDSEGVVIFRSADEYFNCPEITHGPAPDHIHVANGISRISHYQKLSPAPIVYQE